VLAAGIAGAALWLIDSRVPDNVFTLAARFAIGGGLYGVLLVMFRELPIDEIRRVRRWFGR
jgi:hypothetical protein